MDREQRINGLRVWLSPALPELTAEQLDRLADEDERIDARYPDPDEADLREAALSAAVQYLLGETTVDDAGRRLGHARWEAAMAVAVSQQLAAMAVADGTSEVKAAAAAGIDRMTLRKTLGKR